MNKVDVTYEHARVSNWNISYVFIADKLFVAKKIPSKAIPKTLKSNISGYYVDSNMVGLIVDNFFKVFSNNKNFKEIVSYIKVSSAKDAVSIPLKEKYFENIKSELSEV